MEELNEVVKELSAKYNKKEKVIKSMIEKSKKLGYNMESSKKCIDDFYKNCYPFVTHHISFEKF